MDVERSVAIPIRFTAAEAALVRRAAEIERRPISQWARVRLLEILEASFKPADQNLEEREES